MKLGDAMTLEEARTIWLTLLGTEQMGFADMMNHPMYQYTLANAYVVLRDADAVDRDYDRQTVKIKCY
jgi:hypothetical protein